MQLSLNLLDLTHLLTGLGCAQVNFVLFIKLTLLCHQFIGAACISSSIGSLDMKISLLNSL